MLKSGIKDIYIVGNRFEVDRKNFIIDLNKPYIIVCGEKGIGKSVYIDAMKKFNSEVQYLEVQMLSKNIDKDVLRGALKIILISRIFL